MQNGKYTIKELVDKLINAIQQKQEGGNYDFKKDWSFLKSEKKQDDRDVLGMLNILSNDQDCFIFVGVEEEKENQIVVSRSIKGVANDGAIDQNYYNSKNIYPPPNIFLNDLWIKDENNQDVLIQVISLENRYSKPYFKIKNQSPFQMDGLIFLRKNSASVPAEPLEIEELYKYRLRVNENYWDKFVKYLQDFGGWISNSSMFSDWCCYYYAQPEYNIKITRKSYKKADQSKSILNADLAYAGTVILPGFILQHSERKDGVPQCMIPEFLPKNHNMKNGIFYNTCLIASSMIGDFKELEISEKKRVFEEACLANNINWQDS